MPKGQEEIFPNAPLIEAVFEIRFPGCPSLECRRDLLYAAFQKNFPIVQVPTVQGVLPAMGIYQYVSDDGNQIVLSSIRAVGYSTKKYPGFKKFSREALGIVNFTVARFGIKSIKRVGLRYINMIPFTREAGCIPLQRFLNLELVLPRMASHRFENLSIVVTSRMEKVGKLTTRIEAGRMATATANTEVLLLDFDFAMEDNLRPELLKTYIVESHRHTKAFFSELITPAYKEVMRGKVIQ